MLATRLTLPVLICLHDKVGPEGCCCCAEAHRLYSNNPPLSLCTHPLAFPPSQPETTLPEAEAAMLELCCERAQLEDGQQVGGASADRS